MLNELKFVKGAVAKKDYQPALTHFRIKDGRVTGYNGSLALSSVIDIDIEAAPQAIPFVKAIERCTDETTVVALTPSGKLSLRSGGFRAYVDCIEDTEVLDAIKPEGEVIEMDPGFLEAFKNLRRWVGNDASRPWATGILLRGQSAYATNNIVVAEYWIGKQMPEVNLPAEAIDELLRVGEEPVKIQIGERSMTFFYEGDRWLRTQLLGTEWPDVGAMLDKGGTFAPFPEGIFDAIETLIPFVGVEGRLFFRDGLISTSNEEGAGASVAIEDLPEKGAFHYQHLGSLKDVVASIDFTTHPKPCPFRGERLRGLIIGMVDA